MKLYGVARSPFAARVQAAIVLKGLDIPMVPPPGAGLKSPEYLALNPMGRIPTLALDDGSTLPESEVIIEFLEQVFPDPPLLPAEPAARARARLIARIAELYVMMPILGLFSHLGEPTNPDVDRLFDQLQASLGHVDHYLADARCAAGPEPTLADCALAPILFWTREVARMFGRADPLFACPRLAHYDRAMAGHPIFGPLVAAMADDLAALRRSR
jgi:glutathione S-transferase